jgi:UDP-N-acetylmuramoyl-tripeptide--D-alanyl-D-alanine ligase
MSAHKPMEQPHALCTAAEAAAATGGALVQGQGGVTVQAVSTDSRRPMADSLFLALRGPSFDGARFAAQAVAGGARVVLLARPAWEARLCGELPAEVAVVAVEDPLEALGALAAWHRARLSARVVGVTGSNGKTSTKEMVAAVLGGEPGVLSTKGNLNNLVGLPLTLLRLGPAQHHAVLEMGMNAPGEIARLAATARPQVGLITNVHPVHLQGLGSLQAVAEAKGELIAALGPGAVAVLNADDPYVLKQGERTGARRVTFGQSPAADVRVAEVRQDPDAIAFQLTLAGRAWPVRLARLGVHNALNAAAAAAVGWVEGVAPEQIVERLGRAVLPPMRMERLDLGDAHLLVDCYNANPRSVQAALLALSEIARGRPKLAVLGDMLELGEASEQLHRQVGRAAAEARLDGLCAFGPQARFIAEGAREAGLKAVEHALELDEVLDWLRVQMGVGSWVLLKGSRGMRLERVAKALASELGVPWDRGEEH